VSITDSLGKIAAEGHQPVIQRSKFLFFELFEIGQIHLLFVLRQIALFVVNLFFFHQAAS